MTPTAAGNGAGPSKKKARRSSRHGEATPSSHYGPVASTSAAGSALVQANLTVDTTAAAAAAAQQQSSGGGNTNSRSGPRGGNDNSYVLYMSESKFDPVRRRFGGRSKPVLVPNTTAATAGHGAAAAAGSSPSSSSKGVRLSFGLGAKVVATKEAMHATLHCRCVFVLLCELASSATDGSSGKGKASDANTAAAAQTTTMAAASRNSSSSSSSKRGVDTAHLITLSPNDLFCALSVDSFPLAVSTEATQDTNGGGGGGNSRRAQKQASEVVTCALPKAFEVVDGPVVIHRPAARYGEPWRGLEIFRPGGAVGAWRGHRVPLPAVSRSGEEGDDNDDGTRVGGNLVGGDGGKRRAAAPPPFRLDLAAANAAAARDGEDLVEATPTPLSGESAAAAAAAARGRKRAVGTGNNTLLVCPPGSPFPAATCGASFSYSGCGDENMPGESLRECNGVGAAVVALPAAVPAASSSAAEAEDPSRPPHLPPQWTSLFVDREGGASLAPWCGLASESRHHTPTCLSRAPDMDSGVVGLASGALPEGTTAGDGGLILKSLPPTVYAGVALDSGRGGAEATTATEGDGGALLELQKGALSCARLLPAPPSSVMAAAVDDAQGVLAVLLADQAGTALLLARDGCDFPVVEEHRGIAAAFKGDFLGNGREQVALLSAASTGAGGSGGGAGKPGKRGAAALKTGGAGWEQLPLKSLVKRALVTDCSRVWGNERREDLPTTPSGGVNDEGGAGGSRGDVALTGGVEVPKEATKGKKRQRSNGLGDEAGVAASSGANGSSVALPKPTKSEGADGNKDSRLSRLSSVVGVLRRRVQAEEARLLQLRQARRGKAAVLEAAKLALTASVESRSTCGGGCEVSADGGDHGEDAGPPRASSNARLFLDGLVTPAFGGGGGGGRGGGGSTLPSGHQVHERIAEEPPPAPLQCAIARVRFHPPSRVLCLDAHVRNPSPPKAGNAAEATPAAAAAAAAAGPPVTVVDVCLTVASASGHLATRSAVCPRLRPGESATVRASVEVPFGLLARGGGGGGGGGGGVVPGTAASLYASCSWSLGGDSSPVAPGGGTRTPLISSKAGAREGDTLGRPSRSLMFARVLVSPKDMLGLGGGVASLAHAPEDTQAGQDFFDHHRSTKAAPARGQRGGGGVGGVGGDGCKHLGLFDVGTRLDLLLSSSDPPTSSNTSLAALPRAVRSLSEVAALPEAWAGGAAVRVNGCSERAAGCTLRAGDSPSAPAVLLTVAAGALPDGTLASADHASGQGQALLIASAAALKDEMTALEAVARERGRQDGGGGTERLAAALRRYGAAQRKSDVLAAQLAGRVVAARGGAPGEGLG